MCVFCKIIKKEVPAEVVYEDEEVLAILDVNPVTKGHTLVLPKEHVKDFLSASDYTVNKVIKTAKEIAPKVLKAVGASDLNIIFNNGPTAGQSIDHLHLHIIPRSVDTPKPTWETIEYSEGEIKEIAGKIKD